MTDPTGKAGSIKIEGETFSPEVFVETERLLKEIMGRGSGSSSVTTPKGAVASSSSSSSPRRFPPPPPVRKHHAFATTTPQTPRLGSGSGVCHRQYPFQGETAMSTRDRWLRILGALVFILVFIVAIDFLMAWRNTNTLERQKEQYVIEKATLELQEKQLELLARRREIMSGNGSSSSMVQKSEGVVLPVTGRFDCASAEDFRNGFRNATPQHFTQSFSVGDTGCALVAINREVVGISGSKNFEITYPNGTEGRYPMCNSTMAKYSDCVGFINAILEDKNRPHSNFRLIVKEGTLTINLKERN